MCHTDIISSAIILLPVNNTILSLTFPVLSFPAFLLGVGESEWRDDISSMTSQSTDSQLIHCFTLSNIETFSPRHFFLVLLSSRATPCQVRSSHCRVIKTRPLGKATCTRMQGFLTDMYLCGWLSSFDLVRQPCICMVPLTSAKSRWEICMCLRDWSALGTLHWMQCFNLLPEHANLLTSNLVSPWQQPALCTPTTSAKNTTERD